jgi:hypothetical protein
MAPLAKDRGKPNENEQKAVGTPVALCPDAGGLNIYGREP